MNTFSLAGELVGYEPKNDSLAIGTIKNVQTARNQSYTNLIDVNLWGEVKQMLKDIPFGSTVHVEGRLKNDEYEYQGKKRSTLKLNCTSCKVIDRPKQKTPDLLEEIPF